MSWLSVVWILWSRPKKSYALCAQLLQVTYLPLSVIISTFKKENVKRPLDGFGVLVPSKEQQNGFKTMGNAPISVCL